MLSFFNKLLFRILLSWGCKVTSTTCTIFSLQLITTKDFHPVMDLSESHPTVKQLEGLDR